MTEAAPAFEALAADYDSAFTNTMLGRRYRDAIWRRFPVCFPAGSAVLELNCGTGEDAVELARRGVSVLATDLAPAMLAITRAKAAAASLGELVSTRCLDVNNLAELRRQGRRFDAVLSNFGGLNCVADLAQVAAGLAGLLGRGGQVLLCLMGPHVPGEWLWFLSRLQARNAFRRLRAPVSWHGIDIFYPTVGQTRRAFEPNFAVQRSWALGTLLPPPAAEEWAARHPRLVNGLDRAERRIETWPGVARLADHYVLELVRR